MSRRRTALHPSRISLWTLALALAAVPAAAQEAAPAPAEGAPAEQAGKPPDEARALLDEAHRLDDTTRAWKDRTQRLKLLIVDGRAIERRREMIMRTLKGPDGDDKTATVFLSPAEVRGTSFLQFAHQDRDAEQWLFLPALSRVRQISAQAKSESFMGTDFSYRDLELLTDVFEWTEDEAPARLIGTDKIGDLDAALIELTPKKKDVGYERIRLTLTKPDLVIRRMEFYGSGDKPGKVLRLDDVRNVSAIPTAFRLEMVQPQAGSRTEVDVVDVRYDQGLSDDMFTTRALERGALDAE
jgi:outer membrane lipoprotein-sorting protein